jgi:hypothetical protein
MRNPETSDKKKQNKKTITGTGRSTYKMEDSFSQK